MAFDFNKKNLTPNQAYSEMMGLNKKDIQHLIIDQLIPYTNQPFKPYTEEKLNELAEDIKMNGIISPIVVRTIEGGYQILAGHNRVNAAKLVGMETVPCIVKDVDDNTAQLILVNTNLNQRQELFPSEKALAYKMQLDSMKSQGQRTDLTLYPLGTKLDTGYELSEKTSESRTNIFRYIRLTNLISELLDMVDDGVLPFRSSVELSYLSPEQQEMLFDFIDVEGKKKVSLDKATEIRRLAEEGNLNDDTLLQLFCQRKGTSKTKLSIPTKKLKRFFSSDSTEDEMLETIIKALELYRKEN